MGDVPNLAESFRSAFALKKTIYICGNGGSVQLPVKADAGDAFAVLGFSGGKCKTIAQHPIHFKIDDMQIAEDLQLIIGHMVMQWLVENGPAR